LENFLILVVATGGEDRFGAGANKLLVVGREFIQVIALRNIDPGMGEYNQPERLGEGKENRV
jgi:hypothetical protein